jgi:hypothetical protein
MIGQVFFIGEIITKMGWGHLKIFSRTIGPILTRFGTIHPLVKGIQVCSNKGDSPSPWEIMAKE